MITILYLANEIDKLKKEKLNVRTKNKIKK